jgi:hypothetical protein
MARQVGSIDDFEQLLAQSQISTQLLMVQPGETVAV